MRKMSAALLASFIACWSDPAPAGEPLEPAGPPATEREEDEGEDEDEDEVHDPAAAAAHRAAIERALARLDGEPSLAELQRAALRVADADPESVRKWRRAPNLSHVLPRFRATTNYNIERDESLIRYQEKPDRWGATSDHDLRLQFWAQWELSRLVFNPDEVRVHGALANRAQRRENLLATLVGYYYERRRLQLEEIIDPPSEMADIIELRMRIDELTAMIDALTGGLLSSTLEQDSRRRTRKR